jgi:hypothetical protein
MIAKLRLAALAAVEMIEHLRCDIILKFSILDAAGIADDMENHFLFFRYVLADCGKMLGKIVMIRRRSQWPRQRLIADVAVADWMQRADAGMGLRLLRLMARSNSAGVQDGFDGTFHRALPTWLITNKRMIFSCKLFGAAGEVPQGRYLEWHYFSTVTVYLRRRLFLSWKKRPTAGRKHVCLSSEFIL